MSQYVWVLGRLADYVVAVLPDTLVTVDMKKSDQAADLPLGSDARQIVAEDAAAVLR